MKMKMVVNTAPDICDKRLLDFIRGCMVETNEGISTTAATAPTQHMHAIRNEFIAVDLGPLYGLQWRK